MVLLDNLPTDSVLRRHALTERQRVLGLPPTDSVLKRHHAQLMEALCARAAAPAAPARAQAAPVARAAAPTVQAAPARPAPTPAVSARPAPAAPATTGGGGLWGWLRRLLGGN